MQILSTPRPRVILSASLVAIASLGLACTATTTEPDPTAVATVVVAPDSVAANIATTVNFTAQARNSANEVLAGQTVTWSTSAPAIATVNASGLVSLLSLGTATITATVGTKSGTGKVTVTAATLSTLTLTPPNASLAPAGTQQFTVAGTWSNGATTAPAVTYSATGGTISASGLYTAGANAGTFRVIATHTGGILADTSAVTITAVPPTLSTLVLTPPSVSLAPAATQQFAVAGTWSDGSTTPPPATFSATGGTISAGGLYTAGATPGTFRVIATHTGGIRADTSAVTITAPAGALTNECATPQPGWIFCDDFDVNRLSAYFEFETASGAFARVAAVGNEGSFGMRAHWNAGQVDAGALHLAIGRTPQAYFAPADAGTADYREIYWRVYVKNQTGWTGGGAAKLTRAMIFASSTSWAQAMFAHVWSGDTGPTDPALMLDPARGTDANGVLLTTGYNDFAHMTWLGHAYGTNQIFAGAKLGQWHCVESHVKLNDAGQSNGINELWVDGVLDASRTGLNWVGSFNAYGINAVFLENYWNSGSPASQDRFMDNFVVSTQRIGC